MNVNMAKLLVKKEADSALRRITFEMTTIHRVQQYDFVSKNTLKLFTAMEISQNF